MATIVPEVLVKEILALGLSAFKADQTILREVFSTLLQEEQDEYASFFSKEFITLRVGKPPRGPDYKVPMIVIVSQGESEVAEQDLLGDFMEEAVDDFRQGQHHGIRLRSTLEIICIGKDNRQARMLYRTVVAFLILYRYHFEAAGFQNRRITGNKDVVVDLGADPLEGKQMSLTGDYWFSVGTSERLMRYGFQVGVTAAAGDSPAVSVDSYSYEG